MSKSASDQRGKKNEGKTTSRLSLLHDLYVDLLGSLVPGLLTVILGCVAVFLALSTVYVALFHQHMLSSRIPGGMKEILTALHWEFATVIVVSGYVIGAVFFRQDPKRPDATSALHVWMSSRKEERNGLAVQATKQLPAALALDADEDRPALSVRLRAYLSTGKYIKMLGLDTQFPYFHLRCYLAARGLTHLISLVPWCPRDQKTKSFRTKMFINILKIRLLSRYPEMSRDIIRNEAHVRLATSVWYATTTLLYLSCFVLATLLLSSIGGVRDDMGSSVFVSFSFAFLLLLFCIRMRHHLRKCIHYMRVREVIYVLETAHLAQEISSAVLFADLIKKKKSTKCMQCAQIKPSTSSVT